MIVETAGKVTERILLLGTKAANVYFVDGNKKAAIVGGGMVQTIPEILKQIEVFEIDAHKIQYILILHSHFDHCGIVPFFKKRWPWITVTASKPAQDVLMKPKVINVIQSMNNEALERDGRVEQATQLGFSKFTGIAVEKVVGDGDRLTVGDITLEIISVPGHSPCSIAAYLPDEKALFASDAGGIPLGRTIFTAANSNFDLYQQSLDKMAGYDVDIHLAEHYGARTGPDGKKFLKQSIAAAAEARKTMESYLAKNSDIQKGAEEITDSVMALAPPDFLPREIIARILAQMLKYIEQNKRSTA